MLLKLKLVFVILIILHRFRTFWDTPDNDASPLIIDDELTIGEPSWCEGVVIFGHGVEWITACWEEETNDLYAILIKFTSVVVLVLSIGLDQRIEDGWMGMVDIVRREVKYNMKDISILEEKVLGSVE